MNRLLLKTINKALFTDLPAMSASNNLSKLVHTSASLYSTSDAEKKTQENSSADSTTPEATVDVKKLQEQLAKRESEASDFKDRYLRAMADAENTRMRAQKQVNDAKVYGIQGFCKDLLEVADILNLAIKNTDPAKKERASGGDDDASVQQELVSMHKGLTMTESVLHKVFEKNGLQRVTPGVGDTFDPNQHEAVFRLKVPDQKSGTVNVLIKTGYKLNERIIRAAQVGVVQ
jgi:molecular chaperone GrpE